jgi:hypothetical protein
MEATASAAAQATEPGGPSKKKIAGGIVAVLAAVAVGLGIYKVISPGIGCSLTATAYGLVTADSAEGKVGGVVVNAVIGATVIPKACEPALKLLQSDPSKKVDFKVTRPSGVTTYHVSGNVLRDPGLSAQPTGGVPSSVGIGQYWPTIAVNGSGFISVHNLQNGIASALS